jgi:hypothetical protein
MKPAVSCALPDHVHQHAWIGTTANAEREGLCDRDHRRTSQQVVGQLDGLPHAERTAVYDVCAHRPQQVAVGLQHLGVAADHDRESAVASSDRRAADGGVQHPAAA